MGQRLDKTYLPTDISKSKYIFITTHPTRKHFVQPEKTEKNSVNMARAKNKLNPLTKLGPRLKNGSH